VQIIGVGLLRTGTTSLALALEQLGYGPCYNMRALTSEPKRAADWAAAVKDPESADWHRIFAGYESAVGSPSTAFWREIADAFPTAKVILTIREPQKWYESASGTLSGVLAPQPLALRLLTWRGPRRGSGDDDVFEVLDGVQRWTWEREVGGRFADRDHTIAAFGQHVTDVQAHVPADRLLTLDVREGWGPLCAFLGIPEPAGPFPRENDRATFRHRQRVALTRALVPRALATAAVGAALALAAWGRRSIRGLRSQPPSNGSGRRRQNSR